MAKGTARRVCFTELSQYSDLLIALRSNEAVVGGALRPDLPDTVEVLTKRKLNGADHPGVIARTTDFINYRPGEPALAPIDFDLKGMPPTVAAAMDALGGLWPTLISVCPPLAGVERLERASTSAGLFHASTGEPFGGNGGQHLLPDVVLPFDDPELGRTTIAAVLASPADYEGETLADPIEGPEYGPSKAKIMRRSDGSVWIHSFAHGGTTYELRQDYTAVKGALEKMAKEEVVDAFIRLVLAADLSAAELEQLKQIAAARSAVGVRALAATLKSARQQQTASRTQQERDRRVAERRDPRPQLSAPPLDAEYGPEMKTLNAGITQRDRSTREPATRNPNKVVAMTRKIRVPSLHTLTSMETNIDDSPDKPPAVPGTADLEAAE
jgi:hypothetical protein